MLLTQNTNGNYTTRDQLERFSKSDYRWASNKEKLHTKRTIHKGDIFQFEFRKKYSTEMSYKHRGLVIGVKNKLLYVLPICSYDTTKHPDVFHPTDNPASKSDWYLLKASEYNFIQLITKCFPSFMYEFEKILEQPELIIQ